MKICFYTPYLPAIQYASSRIRCFYPYMGMLEIGIESHLGFISGCDYYVINKRASLQIIKGLIEERNKGAKIVYDLCDMPAQNELLDIADLITCPTMELSNQIKNIVSKPVYVWEDCLDYDLKSPEIVEYRSNSVGWFGNWNNAELPIMTLNTYTKRKFVISDTSKIESVYGHYLDESFRLIEWQPENFTSAIKHIGLAIFNVPKKDKYKSDNKVITSLACGVPVLVSKDSSGYHFLEKCQKGLGDSSLIGNQMFLTDGEAQKQIKITQDYIFKNRTPDKAAKQLVDILYIWGSNNVVNQSI